MTSVLLSIYICVVICFFESHALKLRIMVLFYLIFSFSLAYGGINIPLKKNSGFLQGSKEGRVKKIGKYLF